MLHEKTEPSTSENQREGDRGLLSHSSGPVASLEREQSPPPYGAQHCQDALWEGGNEALPPMWTEFKVGRIDKLTYQDNALFMLSLNRPLPGVRLEYPGQLIPGCEWHISPLGRSYFVNHNTRTTSWKKPTPERPGGSLTPECIIKYGSSWYNDNLACLGTSDDIMSISNGSIRKWTRSGRPVGKLLGSDAGDVFRTAVSPDQLMVVGGCNDGTVRLWNIKEGSLVGHPWEGNSDGVWCLDWSPNGAEVAGGFEDGTIRRWNPATGRRVAPPIKKSDEWVRTIKYSPQGDKFASGGNDDMICVWSKDGKLLIEIEGHDSFVMSLCWSKDGAYIFSASYDYTIRKWQSIDGEELVVFRGHTKAVNSLCLSPNGCHLLSASDDHSVHIWDLATNQQVGDPLLHDNHVLAITTSSDGQYFASATSELDAKIYVWNLEAVLKHACGVNGDADIAESKAKPKGHPVRSRDISLAPRRQINNRGLARYGNDFWTDDTNRMPSRSADISSPRRLRDFFGFLRSSTRPANAPPSIQLQPRRLNFSSFPLRISRRPVDVPPCREEDRYGITPESDAEAAAAMERTNSNTANSSTQQGQAVAGAQGSHGRPTQSAQGQSSNFEAGETLIGCCGLYLVRRRPAPN